MILLEIVRSDGAMILCGDGEEAWEILSKEGTGTVESEVFFVEKGYGHGDIFTGERIKGRTFKYTLKDGYNIPQGRYKTSFFFNPLHKYKIKSYFNGKDVWIDAKLIDVRPTEDFYTCGILEVTFYAADPFWKDLTDTKRKFYTQKGLWHYPYALVDLKAGYQKEAYTAYEQIEVGDTAYIYNDGDAPVSFELVIKGHASQPTIWINDSVIGYHGNIGTGSELRLNFEKAEYTLDGANVFRDVWVKGDPVLKRGDNSIKSRVPIIGDILFYKNYNGDV